MSAHPTLDALIACAREAEVRPELVDAAIAEAARAARRAPADEARRSWRSMFGGVGLAAAAALLLWVAWPRAERGADRAAPVRLGDRVAIVAEPGTHYAVEVATDERTELVIERGAVTARLWPGAATHRLALHGGNVTARATGTVYTLAVDARGTVVRVHEGTVEVTTADGARAIPAGAWWPEGAAADGLGTRAAAELRAATPPPAVIVEPAVALALDAGVLDAAPHDNVQPPALRVADAGRPDAAPPPPLVEQWRRSRQLRAQGHPQEAAAACREIADAGDPTWSPIAAVEEIRIHLDALSAPEAALEAADRAIARWPGQLTAEAQALRCRALRQLGRPCAVPTDRNPM